MARAAHLYYVKALSMAVAALSCRSGSTWLLDSKVMAMLACPSNSDTTLGLTFLESRSEDHRGLRSGSTGEERERRSRGPI